MKPLNELLSDITILKTIGNLNLMISSVEINSKKIIKNSLFLAVKGINQDGHQYIIDAVNNGAKVIIFDQVNFFEYIENITFIQVPNTSKIAGIICHNFFNKPSQKLNIVGITGTNGKTTCSTLLYKLFSTLGYKCGLIGTIENKINQLTIAATHTTPDAVELNKLLSQMVDEECHYVFMECSSHALEQNRLIGVQFKGAIFTNLTLDHLDYHLSFAAYLNAKKILFDNLLTTSFALINIDDEHFSEICANTKAKVYTYSLKREANFNLKLLKNIKDGITLSINNTIFESALVGEFNAYNLGAVISTAQLLNINISSIIRSVSNLTATTGRFDTIKSRSGNVLGIIDYAHTPDALENVLKTIKNFQRNFQNLWVVFGCGGNRDKTKRPIMLEIVSKYTPNIIITSDNPRFEKQEEIFNDMLKAKNVILDSNQINYDRELAIEKVVELSNPDDIILIAGKGHEKYQEINGIKHDFDDKKILSKYLNLKYQ